MSQTLTVAEVRWAIAMDDAQASDGMNQRELAELYEGGVQPVSSDPAELAGLLAAIVIDSVFPDLADKEPMAEAIRESIFVSSKVGDHLNPLISAPKIVADWATGNLRDEIIRVALMQEVRDVLKKRIVYFQELIEAVSSWKYTLRIRKVVNDHCFYLAEKAKREKDKARETIEALYQDAVIDAITPHLSEVDLDTEDIAMTAFMELVDDPGF